MRMNQVYSTNDTPFNFTHQNLVVNSVPSARSTTNHFDLSFILIRAKNCLGARLSVGIHVSLCACAFCV